MSNDSWETPQDLFEVLDKGGIYQGIHFEGFHFDIDLCATKENSKCDTFCTDYLEDKIITFEYDRDDMYLGKLDWYDYKTAFMNPPYSNPKPFIEKAWEDSKHCKIICLLKVDPSTKWWATFWNYSDDYMINERPLAVGTSETRQEMFNRLYIKKGPKPGCQVIFFPKRIKFDPPKSIETCKECRGDGHHTEWYYLTGGRTQMKLKDANKECKKCEGTGKKKLSGPSFPSCLVIMDRRRL